MLGIHVCGILWPWLEISTVPLFYTFLPFLSIFGQLFFIINGNGSSLNAMLDEQRLPRIRTNQQGYQPDPGAFRAMSIRGLMFV